MSQTAYLLLYNERHVAVPALPSAKASKLRSLLVLNAALALSLYAACCNAPAGATADKCVAVDDFM